MSTKLSPAMQLAMWLRYAIERGYPARNIDRPGVRITRATWEGLRLRGLYGHLHLTDAGRAWITEQIDAAHTEALKVD